jgi:hypothetical protein
MHPETYSWSNAKSDLPRCRVRDADVHPTTERWYLRPAEGPDKVVLDPELDELEVECERCGAFNAYIYPVTAQELWLCSNCEEAVTHGE